MAQPDPHRGWRQLRFAVGLAATALVAATITLVAWAVVPALLPGWSASVVASGSMEPRIREGDVVATRSGSELALEPGTVVLFDTGTGATLHRIVGHEDGAFVTRGDANAAADSIRLTPQMVRGVGTVLVPWVGLPHRWVALGRWWLLAAAAASAAAALHAARWATDPEADPWPGADDRALGPVELAAPVRVGGLLPADVRREILATHRERR